ncbi:unnamed protein product, partial [Ixodes pacificus]
VHASKLCRGASERPEWTGAPAQSTWATARRPWSRSWASWGTCTRPLPSARSRTTGASGRTSSHTLSTSQRSSRPCCTRLARTWTRSC